MGEELAPNAGVGEEPIAGVEGQPTAETPAQKPAKVELTDLPDFKAWQAGADRRIAAAERRAVEAEKEAARVRDLEEKLAQAQLADADPEDQARYYQSELKRMRQEQEAERQRRTAQQQIENEAKTLLGELGLDMNDTLLDWEGGPTPEGFARLAKSAARAVKIHAEEAAKQSKQEVQEAARNARQQTLVETGASRVSTAAGSPARVELAEEYAKEAAAIRLEGGDRAWNLLQLRKKYREKGYDPLARQ